MKLSLVVDCQSGKGRKGYLQASLIILSPALVVVHIPLQGLLGVLPHLGFLVIVALLLGCLIPAMQARSTSAASALTDRLHTGR